MKKIFALLLGAALLTTSTYAQEKVTTVKAEVKKEKEAKKAKKEAKVAEVTKEVKAEVEKTKLKADGTPDKRFKENKEKGTQAAGPLKKDGTPDMRYKANKGEKKKS